MRKAYSYIRMSTEKQLRGDSLRRQLEFSKKYAKENNLELVDTIDGVPLKDIGISAFRGVNSTKGVLSSFLQALENGKIAEGSVLLIESLDRLSRDDVTNALTQFLNIINLNIEIVTLVDNQKYSKETINNNQAQLFISLGVMLRANEESATKSKRIIAAWNNKRNQATSKPLTRLAPAWLVYSEKNNAFEIRQERAITVTNIFKMCANTCGLWAIARHLNETKVPTFGKSELWNKSYITKIIHNRAVLGEFQPHKLISGKRIPEGEPIKNYFPIVIEERLFYLAHSAINERTINKKGPKGISFSNIFTGLLYCGTCGAKMTLRNRGKLPKGGKTYICNNKFLGVGCTMPDWKYQAVEQQIFQHLHEVEFTELLGSTSEVKATQDELNSLNAQIQEKTIQIERAIELSISHNLTDELKNNFISRANNMQIELDELKSKKNQFEAKLESLNSEEQILRTDEIKKTISKLEENSNDYYFRSSVNQLLSKVINRVELFIDDTLYAPYEIEETDKVVTEFRGLYPEFKDIAHSELIDKEQFKNYVLMHGKRIRLIYKSGAVRHILLGHNVSFLTAKASVKTK